MNDPVILARDHQRKGTPIPHAVMAALLAEIDRHGALERAARAACAALRFHCSESAELKNLAAALGDPSLVKGPEPLRHQFEQSNKHWGCKHCGYPEHEKLKHL